MHKPWGHEYYIVGSDLHTMYLEGEEPEDFPLTSHVPPPENSQVS